MHFVHLYHYLSEPNRHSHLKTHKFVHDQYLYLLLHHYHDIYHLLIQFFHQPREKQNFDYPFHHQLQRHKLDSQVVPKNRHLFHRLRLSLDQINYHHCRANQLPLNYFPQIYLQTTPFDPQHLLAQYFDQIPTFQGNRQSPKHEHALFHQYPGEIQRLLKIHHQRNQGQHHPYYLGLHSYHHLVAANYYFQIQKLVLLQNYLHDHHLKLIQLQPQNHHQKY